jgi:hypothetical protein
MLACSVLSLLRIIQHTNWGTPVEEHQAGGMEPSNEHVHYLIPLYNNSPMLLGWSVSAYALEDLDGRKFPGLYSQSARLSEKAVRISDAENNITSCQSYRK